MFTQMAATGLDFVSGTNDDLIQGNVFYELGAAGIMIGKFSQDSTTEIHIPYNPSDKDEISTRDTIRYNLVTHVTNEHQGAVGIGAGYPRYIVIENNEVSYTNYSGISVGFGWTKEETAMTHNKINKNNIHHIARLLCDSGPIYTLSNQGTDSEIKENYLHDYGTPEWADYWVLPIYLDEGSSGFAVENNSYRNSPSGVGKNAPGYYTEQNNGGFIASVADAAGLQGDYKGMGDWVNYIPLPDFTEQGEEPSGIRKITYSMNFMPNGNQILRVFSANGRFLGRIDRNANTDLNLAESLKQAGFARGVYMVRGTGFSSARPVQVK